MPEFETRYDIEGLATELEVELEDIAALYANYFIEMAEETESMQECLGQKDWYMLERVIHNVKGVSANLNINDVFKEAERFDILLKEGKNHDADVHVSRIIELIQAARGEVSKFFAAKGLAL